MGERGPKPRKTGQAQGGWIWFPSHDAAEIECRIGFALTPEAWAEIDMAMVHLNSAIKDNEEALSLSAQSNDPKSYPAARKRAAKRVQKAWNLLSEQFEEHHFNYTLDDNFVAAYPNQIGMVSTHAHLKAIREALLEISLRIDRAEPVERTILSIAEAKARAVRAVQDAVREIINTGVRHDPAGDDLPFEAVVKELKIHPVQSPRAFTEWLCSAVKEQNP